MSTVLTTETIAIKTETISIEVPRENLEIMRDLWLSDFEERSVTSWSDGEFIYSLFYYADLLSAGSEDHYTIEINKPRYEDDNVGVVIKSHRISIDTMERVFDSLDKPDPEPPAPKAPLPTASIDEVGHATQLDRRPYQFRQSPKMRIYIIDYLQGVIVQHSMNGVIVAFENTKTGAWYDIDFSVETIKHLTYVTMWVNRQHYSTHILMKWKDCFKLYSRVDADLNEHYASIAVGVGRISSEASYMCSLFRDKLIHEAQAKTDTDVTVLPKPEKEMSFKVDGYVMYKGNARQVVYVINGRGGETYIGIRVPIVVEKEAKTTIIFRPESELDIILKAVA